MMNRFLRILVFCIFCMAAGHGANDSHIPTDGSEAVTSADCRLRASRLHGYPTAGFCVFPESQYTRAAQVFSVSAPVQYEFREITKTTDTEVKYGRTVAAEAHPVTLGEASSPSAALSILAEQQADWSKVNTATRIPGMVLVRAKEPLVGAEQWEFRITPAPESGLKGTAIRFSPESELGTGVRQIIHRPSSKTGKPDTMQIELSFSSPIRKSERESIFRSIIIRANGQEAATDGNTKMLTIAGRKATFRLLPHNKFDAYSYTRTIREEKPRQEIVYEDKEREDSLYLEVQAPQALELDIIIPKGTSAANGLTTACDHLHRLSFNPAAPMLNSQRAMILPLKGELDFRLKALNAETLEIKAWRLNADDFLQWEKVFDESENPLNDLLTWQLTFLVL